MRGKYSPYRPRPNAPVRSQPPPPGTLDRWPKDLYVEQELIDALWARFSVEVASPSTPEAVIRQRMGNAEVVQFLQQVRDAQEEAERKP